MTKIHLSIYFYLFFVLIVGFSSLQETQAYVSQISSYAQKATTYVHNEIARLERDEYTDEEIIDELIRLRKNYITRQRGSLYSGRSHTEVSLIITELENAISWYSEKLGNNRRYVSRNSSYREPMYYYTRQNYGDLSYYPYQFPTTSNQFIRFGQSNVSQTYDGNIEIRTSMTRDNVRSYEDFDMFTFILQGNGIRNNTPESSQFLPTSLIREFDITPARRIQISFGAEYRSDRIHTIKTLAQNAYKTSQSIVGLGSSFVDTYTSLSQDDFFRQAIWINNSPKYRLYKLYVAKDETEAFVIEYQELQSASYHTGRSVYY